MLFYSCFHRDRTFFLFVVMFLVFGCRATVGAEIFTYIDQDGNFIQLRALDYATEAHIQDNPAIVVYHPDDGPAYVNIGWCGFIGLVTGMNEEQVHLALRRLYELDLVAYRPFSRHASDGFHQVLSLPPDGPPALEDLLASVVGVIS